MFTQINYEGSIADQYLTLSKQLDALLTGETNQIANLSNASALLNQFLTNINWVGFYLLQDNELVLGPFQGLPACVRIPIGRGVCGTAVATRETVVVKDVHDFPGHIACDAASQSEIVIPLMKQDEIIGVLDIDSPIVNRFTEEDRSGLEEFARTLLNHL
ncbi:MULTISPECIES: GAF domain-containing protein [Lysinibacillus]|uniref:GAF domain-containing protein n=1 Tax=Lysinibacillus TaxID=400634 RepID=UPI001C8BA2C2|nr:MULTISPECIES: GAF domain-containing protein [Lysinibacillus]MBX8944538.1 GAF domain-containing protein [Lysinibacillus sp. K60]UNT56743.1 GAF domain-containing protein [Lysinibacillus capsici]UUV23388.1 GAF domain-containing protein [Lysinibacillus sp. FN11]UYB46258.1 GAF domain-containing protein [Lysinibacillus capsici]